MRARVGAALLGAAVLAAACGPPTPSVYLIGNSLTRDTVPARLDGQVAWHIACGKSLPWILAHPDVSCVDDATLWPEALAATQYDVLVVQPHPGSTLAEDADAIATWMALQPGAAVVVHTGWAPADVIGSEFAAVATSGRMTHSPAWVEALMAELRRRFPEREVRRTRAMDLLAQAERDAASGAAPFDDVRALYRDRLHMSAGAGRYLMHNALRQALGAAPRRDGFALDPELQRYLDGLLARGA